MDHALPTTPAALLGALAAGALLLTACGGDAAADPPEAFSGDAAGEVAAAGSAPEECAAAFPLAQGGDIADVGSIPADFPEPPAGATLCETGGTVGGGQDYATYATSAPIEEVLAHYEGAVPAAHAAERIEIARGEALTGTAGDVVWQVEPRDGGYHVVFQAGA